MTEVMMQGEAAVVVVAAGRGTRAGGDMPKQYRTIWRAGDLRTRLALFVAHPDVGFVQPVIHRDDVALSEPRPPDLDCCAPVFGGATRQASVRAGLEALGTGTHPSVVLVHDAAGPSPPPP